MSRSKSLENVNISSFDEYSIINKNKNGSNFCDKNDNEINNLIKEEISCINNTLRNLSYMFAGCISLVSLPDISKWNTSNVNNMSFMFN